MSFTSVSLPAWIAEWLSGCGLFSSPDLLQNVSLLGMLVGGILLLPKICRINTVLHILFSQSTIGPKPSIDIDGLEVLSVAALVLKVAFSPRCVNRADVVPVHHLGKVTILLRVLK